MVPLCHYLFLILFFRCSFPLTLSLSPSSSPQAAVSLGATCSGLGFPRAARPSGVLPIPCITSYSFGLVPSPCLRSLSQLLPTFLKSVFTEASQTPLVGSEHHHLGWGHWSHLEAATGRSSLASHRSPTPCYQHLAMHAPNRRY